MKTLEEIIAAVPKDHGWLLRKDKTRGYMANVTRPEFENNASVAISEIDHFYSYAATPHDALKQSILRALLVIN